MHKRNKEKIFFLTIALTLFLAACGDSEEVHETNVEDNDQINTSGVKEENFLIIEASQKVLTESEAAETLIYHLQSLDDYYPDIAIYDNDEQYYIFGYYSRANEEYDLKYFSFINYYAVNRETGEIIEQQAWNDSNVIIELSAGGVIGVKDVRKAT